MNNRKTASYRSRKIAFTPLAVAFTLAWSGAAYAAEYWLCANNTSVNLPGNSGNVTVPMWGYALDSTDFGGNCSAAATVPGPALSVAPGDNTLTVHLRNALSGPGVEPVSIVIPGQAAASMVAVKFTDGQGRQRVHSFTAESTAGTDQTYTWPNLKPGTYLYHSGTHPQVQVQMGLYGALTHDAAAGQAYTGVPYSSEVTLLFSEIDPALHAAVAAGTYGTASAPDSPGCFAGTDLAGNPAPTKLTSTICYMPKYFLINGVPHTAASVPVAAGSAGQTTLLRLLNAGLMTRSPVLQGQHVRLTAEDGNKYPYAREQYSVFLPALKTIDAIFTPTTAATYPFYDRRLALTNPGVAGSVAGGMLTLLAVSAGPAGTPLAVNDIYSIAEDGTLAVAASSGVLVNDTPAGSLTASLLSGTGHGSLSLAADGSFSYTPHANYNGADSFTYQAVSGGIASLPATVNLAVIPVNDPPQAVGNAYSVLAGTTLSVTLPGVLGNDSDIDGNALTALLNTSVSHGSLGLNANGSFSYTPTTGYSGPDSFTYRASDGLATSAPATVTLTVLANRPPVARNDTASTPRNTPVVISVLANDTDPDNNINPATVVIVTAPNQGGTATVNANGTVNFTPRLNFRGSDTFSYRVRDTGNLLSNTASVKVNVR